MNIDEEFQHLKLPPHSAEAEQAVIGGLMIDSRYIDNVADVVMAADFFRPAHRMIFQTILDLHSRKDAVDLLIVAEELARRGELDEIGGASYLTEIAGNTPTTSNVVAYAKAVKVRAVERAIISAANQIADMGFNGDISVEEKIAKSQQMVMAIGETEAERQLYGNAALKEWVEGIDQRFNSESTFGVPTGLKNVDARFHGLQPSDLVILAGRPSMGKSTMAFQMGANAAVNGHPTMIFSMEMSRGQIYNKVGAYLGGIPLERLRTGKLEGDDWSKLSSAVAKLKDRPFYVDDRPGLHVNQIKATARRMHRKEPLKVIVVDYLQLAKGDGDNRTGEIGNISRELKGLAKELDCTVIALCQLNRKCEERSDKRPLMSDLRDSGELEQDADIILFVYRDDVYHPNTDHQGITELICRKFRNGEIGTDYLYSRLELSRFENMTGPVPAYSEPDHKSRSAGLDY